MGSIKPHRAIVRLRGLTDVEHGNSAWHPASALYNHNTESLQYSYYNNDSLLLLCPGPSSSILEVILCKLVSSSLIQGQYHAHRVAVGAK